MGKLKKWSQEEIDFIKNNYLIMSHKEIGLALNRTEGAIRTKCFHLDLCKKESEWSNDEISFLKNNYSTMTQNEIAKKLGRTRTAVNIKASKLGLKKRYEFNEDFFEKIDNEEKAYWLGFIWADGSIAYNTEKHVYELSIELQSSDLNHLKKFNKSLNGNLPVSTRIRESSFEDYPNKQYKTAFIRVHSKKLVEDLIKHNCIEDKSHKIGMPDISDEYMWHFIRGFFDGDGCVCYKDNKTNLRCDFTSVSSKMVEELRAWLYKNNINTYIYMDKNKYRLCIAGRQFNLDFLSNLYDNSTIYLERKYKKQLNIRQTLKQHSA